MDFDPKPEAPIEFRGELRAIQTTLPGIQFCEVLPRLAHLTNRFNVIRSLHQPSSDHVVGSHNVLTGWDDETENSKSRYPDLASVISRKRSEEAEGGEQIGESTDPRLAMGLKRTGAKRDADTARHELPRYVDISSGLHRGGRRQQGLASLDFAEQMRASDAFRGQALDLLTGSGAARAFDVSREPERVRQRYGLHTSGQQCLLARRLVEGGVSVVVVRFCPDGRGDYEKTMIGWDDHAARQG